MAKEKYFFEGSYYPRNPVKDPQGYNCRIDFAVRPIAKIRNTNKGNRNLIEEGGYYYAGIDKELPDEVVKEIRANIKKALDDFNKKKWSYPLIIRKIL